MAVYRYEKASAPESVRPHFQIKRQHIVALSYFLMVIGIGLITYVGYPIFGFEIKRFLFERQPNIVKPVPENLVAQNSLTESGPDASAIGGVVFGEQTDLSQIDSWFPAASPQRVQPSKVTHYNLSIPKLGIIQAVVTIAGEDLMASLIHYGGTALPGDYGSGVIFGHSVLPQFFNPHDYKTIFSTIPTLEAGDEVLVDFDGIELVYQVERYYEVSPEQVDVLQQYFNRQCLKLVTCVPPGLYLRRGIVKACLVN